MMNIDTGAFGLGGTKKTFEEIISQIIQANTLFDTSLTKFVDIRMNRDTDKAYYGEEGLEYLKKLVGYQNRINNRIGKLWLVYKMEVKEYHKERREKVDSEFPDPDSIEPKLERPSTPPKLEPPSEDSTTPKPSKKLKPGYSYVATEDFVADSSDEINLTEGKRYIVLDLEGPYNNGWIYVRDPETNEENYAPEDFFDVDSELKQDTGGSDIEIEPLKENHSYIAIKNYESKLPNVISLTKGERYLMLENESGNMWIRVRDLSNGDEKLAPYDMFDPTTGMNETVQTRETDKYYIAKFDFEAEHDDELSLTQGKQYILKDVINSDWSSVQDPITEKTGLVPNVYLSETPYDGNGDGGSEGNGNYDPLDSLRDNDLVAMSRIY